MNQWTSLGLSPFYFNNTPDIVHIGDVLMSTSVKLYFGLEEGVSTASGAAGHVPFLDLSADYMGVVSL